VIYAANYVSNPFPFAANTWNRLRFRRLWWSSCLHKR